MTCDKIRAQLTAYLDGELSDDRGSAVRGHLRGCQACRDAARDEAALRDGLRELPPVDPPASLWAGVQAKLAEAEVADAERPAWRRALARWTSAARLPRYGVVLAAAAAAFALVVIWKSHHAEPTVPTVVAEHATPTPTPTPTPVPAPVPVPAPMPLPDCAVDQARPDDVTADLAGDRGRKTTSYACTAAELERLAHDARASWPADRQQVFDAHVGELHAEIAKAEDGRPRQTAYRALIRYLRGAAIRDEVVANDRALAGGVQ